MPLSEMTIMDQRLEFILLWKSGEYNFSQLCREFNISRPTGYRYLENYEKYGEPGLVDKSRAPLHIWNKTPKAIEERVIAIRKEHKRWGPKKIQWRLENDGIYSKIPAKSTINLILKRNGLIPDRKTRKRITPQKPIFDPTEPNEVWSADFKGKFKMKNGDYCHPLTICDSKSRFILEIKGLERTTSKCSRGIFEAVFKEYGLPLQLHTDNGAPFANIRALGRLTQLGVWLMELGIQPVYSDPGHPEQNGRHERMHRELKAEACTKPAANLQTQQIKFNRFRHEYNEERPHEALGMVTPKYAHTLSPRPYPEEIEEWNYPNEFKIRYVCKNGAIRVGKSRWIFVTLALKEKRVGLEELGEGIYRLYFRNYLLGFLDENELKVYDIQEYTYVPRV